MTLPFLALATRQGYDPAKHLLAWHRIAIAGAPPNRKGLEQGAGGDSGIVVS